MKNNDETILEILQGHKTSKWPSPKIVKIFIGSTKHDFMEERRVLLENVGPDLQNYLDNHEIEVELIDMHFGSGENDQYNPFLFHDHINEIKSCHKFSKGCFFMGLIGEFYGPLLPPLRIEADVFSSILAKCSENNTGNNPLETWYHLEDDFYVLKDLGYEADWKTISPQIISVFYETFSKIDCKKDTKEYLKSVLERQFNYSLGLSPGTAHHVINIFRKWDNVGESSSHIEKLNYEKIPAEYFKNELNNFRSKIMSSLPDENILQFSVPWKDGGINQDYKPHEEYLYKFRSNILNFLKKMIDKTIEEEPELKSRKKIVQENFQENITHLTLCHSDIKKDFQNSEIVDKIKEIVTMKSEGRHNPIIIYGNQGSGKTSILQTVFRQFENWLPYRCLRIIRFASLTPQSSYNLELLRIMCQQICIALKLPEGFLPKDASFEPLYINKWFQTLIRKFEDHDHGLAIFIDDIHLLNPLDFDVVSGLSWLPISLPKKVFIVCTTGNRVEDLKLTPIQRDKFRGDSYLELPIVPSLTDHVIGKLKDLEEKFSKVAVKKLVLLLNCTQYGLSELEMLEMLMPTNNNGELNIKNGEFNFSSFCSFRNKLGDLIREKYMKGRLLLDWSHFSIKEIVTKQYELNQEIIKNTHNDLANFYFDEFCNKEEDSEGEGDEEPAPLLSEIRETPFKSTLYSDVIYSLRHIEESWIHLLKAGDIIKLKNLCLCNYDFLLAALQTFAVSYLRCLLKHARCYILDREIELVYYSIKMSSDVLTRDTYQLGTQLISWLRPASEKGVGLINTLITSAMAWCDGFTLPLVVPLTDWLQPPLSEQTKTMTVPGVRLIECTPSGQHIVCVETSDPQLWHIMTNQLIHTFIGHTGLVTCMSISKQSQFLFTGSDDLSVIIWDLKSLNLTLKINEHVAPVTCITVALSNSIIISGGEDSSVIVSSTNNGKVIKKIDHHRGPVKSVKTTSTGDVLLSASEDYKVCLWSLETFTLLNTITLGFPIQLIDVSPDSVFLLSLCKDNSIYIRTVATGTKLHTLSAHKSRVNSVCVTQDSSSALIGCADGKIYVYNIHNGKLQRTITGQSGREITCLKMTDRDDFLMAAGGNRVNIYPFREYDINKTIHKPKKRMQNPHLHTGYLTCIDISRDGLLSASGGTDSIVNIWQLNNQELTYSLMGHSGAITSVNFSPNGLFVCSGSEDKTVKVWSLANGELAYTFNAHQSAISCVYVLMDSVKIISSDKNDNLFVWMAENGHVIKTFAAPHKCIRVTNNIKYSVASNGDTGLKIWSLLKEDEKYTVNHSKEITCFELTMDSKFVITGSKDMSLKVWQVVGGKLSQVLMGHTAAVTCVAVSVADKTQIISGSLDNNLIIWDINTGADLHTLSAHLSYITSVKLSGDGTLAISGSDDKTIIIWDTRSGLQLTSLQLHLPVMYVEATMDFSRISILLKDSKYMPIICLHNTSAKFVKIPTYTFHEKDIVENPKPGGAKRQMKRLLKKEVSLDTYTWQKKYAHLTSNLVIPAVDEKFKRRFSISASMEEISKLPQNKDAGSQGNLAKQASLAQSQHFDQLEALWNERSPPRRRLQQSLSKQSSLVETYSSDDENLE